MNTIAIANDEDRGQDLYEMKTSQSSCDFLSK